MAVLAPTAYIEEVVVDIPGARRSELDSPHSRGHAARTWEVVTDGKATPIKFWSFPTTSGRTRFAELRRRGVGVDLAAQTAGSAHGPWRISNSPALAIALPNDQFRKTLGLASLAAATTA